MKVAMFSVKGVKSGDLVLPQEFGEKPNMALLAQAIRVYTENGHLGLVKTKTRAEVNRTKKKLYRQKGTGGARHGSRRAPIFVGGGVAHGPRPIRRVLFLPIKMKKKALASAFSLKIKKEEIVGVSGIEKITKTKEAQFLADKILKEVKGSRKLTFALSQENIKSGQFLRNLKNVEFVPYKDLNAYTVYLSGALVIDKNVFEKTPKVEKVLKNEGKKQGQKPTSKKI